MKIFLKVLEKLKKKEAGNPYLDCRYDKGWNAAIKKIEGIIASYNISDMC